jgi:hypothetical protein
MERASWSYELPPAGSPDVQLEQYQIRAPDGEAWKAAGLVRDGEDVYVVAAPSGFAVARQLVAIPWRAVERVDHDEITIYVASLEGALQLDPDRAVESGPADAPRVTELPSELTRPQPPGDLAGPRDRWPLFLGIGSAAVGFVALLGVVLVLSETREPWLAALLVLPASLLLVAAVAALAAWKRPYAPATRPRQNQRVPDRS